MEGVTPEALRFAQREASEAQRRLAATDLELRAALDSLEVYRRAEEAAAAGGGGGRAALVRVGGTPDEGKSEEEVRSELAQLREVLQIEVAEREKVRRPGFGFWGGGRLGTGAGVAWGRGLVRS